MLIPILYIQMYLRNYSSLVKTELAAHQIKHNQTEYVPGDLTLHNRLSLCPTHHVIYITKNLQIEGIFLF